MDLLMVSKDMLDILWGYHFPEGHIETGVWTEAQRCCWHIDRKELMVPWLFIFLNNLKPDRGVLFFMDNTTCMQCLNA